MATFARQLLEVGGFPGAPGVNVLNYMAPLHGSITQTHVDDFYDQVVASLDASDGSHWASGVTVTPALGVGVHDVATGDLVNYFTVGSEPYTLTGTGSGSENRATQIGMRWLTADFRYGRRVQGRTFMGPASSAALDSDGTVAEDIVSGWPDLWSGIYDAGTARLIVWSRPKPGREGEYSDVTGLSISQMPFVLRGRR
jgi:hypothetical protein